MKEYKKIPLQEVLALMAWAANNSVPFEVKNTDNYTNTAEMWMESWPYKTAC